MDEYKPMVNGALYYPYIHITDLNWLKANLLVFPKIKRMIPMDYTPDDTQEIRKFTEWCDGKDALLQPADLWSGRLQRAQENLANKLRQDIENTEFAESYGENATRAVAGNHGYGFQIHVEKLFPDLSEALVDNKLAWKPVLSSDPQSGFIEVHPRVGEAVMSTLAVACAQANGLDIVGDRQTGPLHRCLLEKDLDAIYDTWLKPNGHNEEPKGATGEELFEFILGIPGDLSMLTAEKLRALADEREPIHELIATLRNRAAQIPKMDPGKDREDAFKQAASEVMDKWTNDRKNWPGFFREFFSTDVANLTTNFASKVADKTLTGMVAGAATKTTAATVAGSAGWVGALATGGIIGAGTGLVIGLIAHAGKTYYKRSQTEKKSPYRFLTALEDAGIVLQSEAVLQG